MKGAGSYVPGRGMRPAPEPDRPPVGKANAPDASHEIQLRRLSGNAGKSEVTMRVQNDKTVRVRLTNSKDYPWWPTVAELQAALAKLVGRVPDRARLTIENDGNLKAQWTVWDE